MPAVDPARNQIVPSSLGRRFGQKGGLDLEESLLVQLAACFQADLMAESHVRLQGAAPQIQEPVTQARFFRGGHVSVDRKGGSLGTVQDPQFRSPHFDRSGRDLLVDGVFTSLDDLPDDGQDELRTDLASFLQTSALGAADDLHDAAAVAQVQKDKVAKIANAVHPTHDRNGPAHEALSHSPAVTGAFELSKMFHASVSA